MTEKSTEKREGGVKDEEGDQGDDQAKGPSKDAVDAAASVLDDRKKDDESR